MKNRGLTENQSQLRQEKLRLLDLKETTVNPTKYYNQKLSEFKAFLKSEFSFTPMGYYREKGMTYGMLFGIAIVHRLESKGREVKLGMNGGN